MDSPWYLRLFYIPMLSMAVNFLFFWVIRAKRMAGPELSKYGRIAFGISFAVLCSLMWFVSFRINPAFWVGVLIIALGQLLFALSCSAMREHPEKEKTVVDWGVYKITRHPHVLAGLITTLGAIVMGWSPRSVTYLILWLYLVWDIIWSHLYVLREEKINVDKFGQEYQEYMKIAPRYFWMRGR